MSLAVVSTLKSGTPALSGVPLRALGEAILGKKYELTLTFVGPARSRTLNRTYRKKDKPTNVLAFPLEKNVGEIILCAPYAQRECARFGHTYPQHIAFLFIHAALHLKGHRHGRTMEAEERRVWKKFFS